MPAVVRTQPVHVPAGRRAVRRAGGGGGEGPLAQCPTGRKEGKGKRMNIKWKLGRRIYQSGMSFLLLGGKEMMDDGLYETTREVGIVGNKPAEMFCNQSLWGPFLLLLPFVLLISLSRGPFLLPPSVLLLQKDKRRPCVCPILIVLTKTKR